jgi:hypothetical protein
VGTVRSLLRVLAYAYCSAVIPSRAENASPARPEGPREHGIDDAKLVCVIEERRRRPSLALGMTEDGALAAAIGDQRIARDLVLE